MGKRRIVKEDENDYNSKQEGNTLAQAKYEDMIMKRVMESFAQSGLRFLGITDEIVQPAETEMVLLEMQDLLMDYTFLLSDGSYLHLEFQSTDKGETDLRRFRKYEALLSDKKGKDVYTYVIYTNDIKQPRTHFKTGFNEYCVKAITLAEWDSRQVIEEIKRALEQKTLEEEQMTALAFVPVMTRREERVEIISEAVRLSHKVENEQKKMDIQAILFAFANKFLSGKELERIKEEIVMTRLGQMIYEDGVREGFKNGIEEGRQKGKQEGKLEGKQEGKLEGKLEAARALLDILSDEAIAERIKIPVGQVKKLRQEGKSGH